MNRISVAPPVAERRSDGDGTDSNSGGIILKGKRHDGDNDDTRWTNIMDSSVPRQVHQQHKKKDKKKKQQQQHSGRIRATVLVSAVAEPSPDDPSGRLRLVDSVPHEPYKAAVHAVCQVPSSGGHHQFAMPAAFTSAFCRGGGSGSSERIVGVREVPSAERLWAVDRERLEVELQQLRQDKTRLAAQLQMQAQVNGELKRLLVASVGEDMESRVHFLTEDKTRLAHSLLHYSQKQTEDVEHLERLTIQCDVWRSKFLATSLMVDELASWKAVLGYRLDEAIEAIRILLEEFDQVHHHCRNAVGNLNQLHRSVLPPSTVPVDRRASASDVVEDAATAEKFAETVRRELHGVVEPYRPFTGARPKTNECLTRGQRMAHQVLSNSHNFDLLPSAGHMNCLRGVTSSAPRFHPSTRYEHLTFNCCGHCRGDIKLM